jgi:hypothetical protein
LIIGYLLPGIDDGRWHDEHNAEAYAGAPQNGGENESA